MRKVLLISFVVLAFISVNAQQQKVNWLSFEKAIQLNKSNPKPILIDVYTDWCGYCKKMDLQTYTNTIIAKTINENFYAVKLDGEEKKDIFYKEYAFKYKAQGRRGYHELAATLMDGKLSYPTTIFLSEKEDLLQRIPGYLDTKTFEKILAYFSGKTYEKNTWEEFEDDFKSNL